MAKLAEQAERYDGIYSYKIVFVQHPWKMSGLVHVTSSHNFNEEAVDVCKYNSAISPCNISVIDACLICHSVEFFFLIFFFHQKELLYASTQVFKPFWPSLDHTPVIHCLVSSKLVVFDKKLFIHFPIVTNGVDQLKFNLIESDQYMNSQLD
jgi:hypothetical protein